MAIYHLSVKTIGRATGRSATAAAAYRAAAKIVDERTGEVHNFTRKKGVESATLVLPADAPKWASNRAKLWSAAELSEKRKNSTVAREFEIALPAKLSADERRQLAHDFARELVTRHGFAADVAIHAPGKEGDTRNHHAHILCTTRRLTPEGFGAKCRELDDRTTGEVDYWRERFAELQNDSLARAGVAERVDHRSFATRGISWGPTEHLGPHATAYERRTEEPSDITERRRDESLRWEAQAELVQLERKGRKLSLEIAAITGALGDAQAQAADAERQRLELEAQAEREAQERAELQRLEALAAERAAQEAAEAARAAQEAQAEAAAQEAARAEQERLEAVAADQAAQEAREAAARAAVAQAQAAAAQAARAEQERQAVAQQAERERQRLAALAKARQAYNKAEQQLEQAVQAEGRARTGVEQSKNAYDWAMLGQERAVQSVMQTAKAALKIPGWARDIERYNSALEALAGASKVVQTAQQAVDKARAKVLTLDPAERAAIVARHAALQASLAPAPARPARQQAPRAAPVQRQVRQVQDDDQEQKGPAPGM